MCLQADTQNFREFPYKNSKFHDHLLAYKQQISIIFHSESPYRIWQFFFNLFCNFMAVLNTYSYKE